MKTREIEILLVEDNPNDAELTLNNFKKHNLINKIHWVEDGEQAIDYLFATGKYTGRNVEDKPKLILLDLKLPKVDGLEVLQKVKSDERLKTIPVVILTSSREETDIIKSYQLGVNSYIVKPVDFEHFSRSVSELGLYWLVLNQPPE
jgi:two-component system response regulator